MFRQTGIPLQRGLSRVQTVQTRIRRVKEAWRFASASSATWFGAGLQPVPAVFCMIKLQVPELTLSH